MALGEFEGVLALEGVRCVVLFAKAYGVVHQQGEACATGRVGDAQAGAPPEDMGPVAATGQKVL